MPDKSTQVKFILISLCIGAVVVSIPVDKIDNDIRNMIAKALLPLFFCGFAAWMLYQRKKILDLKKRCHVKVTAECVGLKKKHHYGVRGCFVTAFYAYEYNGKQYTGCNNWDTGSNSRGIITPGDKTEIYINPDCLPDEIYDPIADISARSALNTAIMLLIITVVIVLLPLLFGVYLRVMGSFR